MDKLNRTTLARAVAGRPSKAAQSRHTVSGPTAKTPVKATRAFGSGRAAAAIQAFLAAREQGDNPSFPQKARRPAKG